MNTVKYIFKKIKLKPFPAIIGLIGIILSPLISNILNSFVQWLSLAPNANISTLLVLVFVLSIILLVILFYLFSFATELKNPFEIYPYDEESNICLDVKTGKRYCPTCIIENKKSPVRRKMVWGFVQIKIVKIVSRRHLDINFNEVINRLTCSSSRYVKSQR